jgi:hypothetical protein
MSFLTPDADGTNQMHGNKDKHFALGIKATKSNKEKMGQRSAQRKDHKIYKTTPHLLGNESEKLTRDKKLFGPLKEGIRFFLQRLVVCCFTRHFHPLPNCEIYLLVLPKCSYLRDPVRFARLSGAE